MAVHLLRPYDPKETYVVRRVFCCGEGHCPGVRYTHWEAGEACTYVHDVVTDNESCHFYSRLVLTPKNRGNPNPEADQYADENGDWWEFAHDDENVNKWCFLIVLGKDSKLKEGHVLQPGEAGSLLRHGGIGRVDAFQ